MNIHKEGRASILIGFVILVLLSAMTLFLLPIFWWLNIGWFLAFLFLINFFRNPDRTISQRNENWIYSPADGKVVVIEETIEKEYFKDKRLLISIFMSPLDVHANRIPISGQVIYSKHQPGQFLPAFNPKSSELNERHSVVIESLNRKVLIRQIAGIMARRICNYCEVGQKVKQGEELGLYQIWFQGGYFPSFRH